MTSQMPSPMQLSSNSSFGILGDFPGDEELLLELNRCCDSFQSKDTGKPPLAHLVSLLGSLPLKGRHAVVQEFLASSPHRDAILRDLFDYCFQPDEKDDQVDMEDDDVDNDFVLIANPKHDDDPEGLPKPLNLNRFHIFQVAIVLMAVSGSAGAEMSRKYLRMASTKYRAKILIQCATCFENDVFTDQELWEYYQSSPSSDQNKVVEACKRSGKRKDFLRRVYEDDGEDSSSRHQDLIYWLESEYLAGKLEKLSSRKESFKLKRWGAHGDLYIDYIRRKMQEVKNDQLKLGSTWAAFRGRMELNSVRSSHVYALLELLEGYEAYKCQLSLASDARKYLEGLSAQGEDVSRFDVIIRIHIDSALLRKLTKQERLQLAFKYVQDRDWAKFSTVRDQCSGHKLPYKTIHSEASSSDLWLLLSGQEVDPFFSFFLSNELFLNASDGPQRAEILKSWAHLHLRSKPSDLSDQQLAKYCPGKSSLTVWSMWYESYSRFYKRGGYSDFLSDVFSVIAREGRLPADLCSRLKIYTLYAQELLDIAVQGMEEVSTHLETHVAMDPVLRLLRDLSYDQLSKSGVEAARALAQKGAKVRLVKDGLISGVDVVATHAFLLSLIADNHGSRSTEVGCSDAV